MDGSPTPNPASADRPVAGKRQAFLPSRAFCTDNAAMIAAAAWYRLRADGPGDLRLGAVPGLRLPVM